MITIFFIFVWIAFSYVMSNFVIGGYFIILWSVLGVFVGYLGVAVLVFIHFPIFSFLSIHNRYKAYFTRSASFLVTRTLLSLRVKVINKHLIPKKGALVIYANHKSAVDPLIILEIIKRPVGLTPKSSLYKNFLLRKWMQNMGSFPIYREDDRKTAKLMIQTIKNVKDGFSMLVFPEGGRKDIDSDIMKQSKAGSFKIAQKAQAVIVPITINGSSVIRDNAPFKPSRVTIIVHEPILPSEYQDLNTFEISQMVMTKINEGIQSS